MKIVSLNFTEISAEKNSQPKPKMEIKTNLNIEGIQKDEIAITNQPALKFDFSYSINYEPNIAKILLRGEIIAIDDENKSDAILKEWKKKQFSDPMKVPMFNFILNKCNTKAILMEEELNLPFHLPFPQINPQTDNSSKSSETTKKPVNYTG